MMSLYESGAIVDTYEDNSAAKGSKFYEDNSIVKDKKICEVCGKELSWVNKLDSFGAPRCKEHLYTKDT